MKRLVLLAVNLSVAALLAAGLSTQARAEGGGAGVERADGQCLISNNTSSWLFSCNIQIVFQPNGMITQHITGSVIPEGSSPLPSQAVADVTGGPCLKFGDEVLTTVVAGVVTPSGQVKLTCKS